MRGPLELREHLGAGQSFIYFGLVLQGASSAPLPHWYTIHLGMYKAPKDQTDFHGLFLQLLFLMAICITFQMFGL